jgi:hemolysin activation/secretion protein
MPGFATTQFGVRVLSGKKIFVAAGVSLLASLCLVPAAWSAPDSQTDMLDSLRREQLRREQQRLDDVLLPGATSEDEQEPLLSEDDSCFPVSHIEIEQFGDQDTGLVSVLRARLPPLLPCYGLQAIQSLQRQLGNELLRMGYVTSRLLLPEQNLASGTLVLLLVPGRIEKVESEQISERVLTMALPPRRHGLLNLRDLEQAMENLGRVPGLAASFDLAPGETTGGTRVIVHRAEQRAYRAALFVNEKYYGSTAHGIARASLELGSPFGMTDRMVLSVNSDLDDAISDKAWGFGVDYDLGWHYWLVTLAANRQAYETAVVNTFSNVQSTGTTDSVRSDLSRVVYRTDVSRLTIGGFVGHTDVLNELQGIRLAVSSYRLGSAGVRIDGTHLWRRYQFGLTANAEHVEAGSAAAVFDRAGQRYQLYATALRSFDFYRSAVQIRLNGQFSDAELVPASRFSITALVRGYEDIAFSGNSGAAASMEYSVNPTFADGVIGLRPYLGVEAGWIPERHNDPETHRLAAWVAGAAVQYKRMALTLESAWPWDQVSTATSGNEYVLRSSFNLFW